MHPIRANLGEGLREILAEVMISEHEDSFAMINSAAFSAFAQLSLFKFSLSQLFKHFVFVTEALIFPLELL